MKRTRLLLVLFPLALILGLHPVLAQNKNWPPAESVTDLSDSKHWPNDPGYKSAWELYSFIPASAKAGVRKAELSLGSGLHADRAWQRTAGDPRVVIAELDSGIKWSERDLVNKFYLNRGELPKPDKACQTAAYDPAKPWDANGDGKFNVQDYTKNSGHAQPTSPCDPVVKAYKGGWDTNGNKVLDPQDLIQIFSDGKDDDNNGYIDDISGWDFFDNDNDANDDTNYGHGTAEAKWSAAEGNNGRGSLGTCPRCLVMPVRVGDSFVVEGNDFAQGVVFAVDSGAAIVQEALGAINNGPFVVNAIDYAYRSNVAVIGAAGDENGYHYNFPASNDHATKVHAIVHDGTSVSTSSTFLNFNNCTNYGPRLDLSTPGRACSSEGTGKTAGVAGLIYSAALKAKLAFPGGKQLTTDKHGARRLTSEEVRQVLLTTVDDIDVPESKTDKTKYPSRPGWEQRFGHGRTNARNAVDAVLANKIPPEVDITAPGWFDVVYPASTPTATIVVRLAFRADLYETLDYAIEWAAGADPADKDFKTLSAKTGLTKGETIKYGWEVSKLVVDNPDMPAPDYGANRRMVTLRVRATAHSKTLGKVKGVGRRAIHVEKDGDLLPGFPVRLGASAESSPRTADLDGDGKREIVLATSDGRVHAFTGGGKELSGWPVKVKLLPPLDPKRAGNHRKAYGFTAGKVSPDQYSNIMASPAIGDLDGDKKPEVVVASFEGDLFVFAANGTVRPGFPVSVPSVDNDKVSDRYNVIDDGIMASPSLADLDGDKKLEIVVGALDGKIYVWRHDGKAQAGFPVQLQDPLGDAKGVKVTGRIVSSPAIGDIDGDGVPDIVVGTNEKLGMFGSLYVVHGQGSKHQSGKHIHEGWPVRIPSVGVLPMVGEGLPLAPALADVNGDGLPEIGVGGIGTAAAIFRNTGERKIPLCFSETGVDPDPKKTDWVKKVVPCTRKITGKCEKEEAADKKVVCVSGALDNSHYGAKSDSKDLPSVVLISYGSFGDVDNDKVVDFTIPTAGFGAAKAFAAGGKRADFELHVGAWNTTTREYLPAFPRRIDDWLFFMTPSVADINGDDYPEVIVASAGYWVRAWDKDGKEPTGWPKLTGQWVIASPAVGDVTGDGKLEVVVASRSGWLFAWKTTGKKGGRVDWESYGHDNRNTRNLETPLSQGIRSSQLKPKPDAGVSKVDGGSVGGDVEDEGCSCGVGGGGGGVGLVLVLVVLGWRRRREWRTGNRE